MLDLTSAFAARLAARQLTLTVCWRITKSNGESILGTAHDRDIEIPAGEYAGLYRSHMGITSSDVVNDASGAVQNLEVDGAFFAVVPNFTVEDLEAGLYDQAQATLLLVDWREPGAGQKALVAGTLGEFRRDSHGWYRTEVRSAAQALSQQIVRTASERCDVKRFGDERCQFDVLAKRRTGTVSAVANRKTFTVDLDAGPAPVIASYYLGGILRWTAGDNAGFFRSIRLHSEPTLDGDPQSLEVTLQDEAPADVEIGDTVTVDPGCDLLPITCKLVHENFINFRGVGIFAVGRDRLMSGTNSGVDTAYSARLTQATLDQNLEDLFDDLGWD
jgi:uncharacterized phage protein (TIGR02218 family)